MKKTFILIALCCIINSVTAKIWTVDNTGKVANFTTTTAAVAGAQNGDTLLIGGSPTTYADINLSKKLIIYGTGYFLTENPNTIETRVPVTLINITFSFGSNGSELIGVTGTLINVTIDAANIVIRRCHASRIILNGNNCMVKQCYVTYSSSNWPITISGINNIVRNCFIQNTYTGSNASFIYAITSTASNIIENNVIYGHVVISGSSFGNNIIRYGNPTFTNCDPYNNICNDIQCGTANGNQAYINMTNVFLASGTSDSKWQLSTTSVAKGAGREGQDCGMYGGNDPYILSGMPEIPVITSIVVPSRTNPTNGLNVQINIRSNK